MCICGICNINIHLRKTKFALRPCKQKVKAKTKDILNPLYFCLPHEQRKVHKTLLSQLDLHAICNL